MRNVITDDKVFSSSNQIANPHIDVIVVPASRSIRHLRFAIELARHGDAFLLVLCSHRASAAHVSHLACRSGARGMAIDLPAGWRSSLLQFATSHHAEARFGRHTDLSQKRNIGLLLAQLARWEGLFFLDDDIRGLNAAGLRTASAALQTHDAAGFMPVSFPDNSVVRHAERLSGRPVTPAFCTGSAMALQTAAGCLNFFPDVYNEDWLFLYDALSERTAVQIGEVQQLPYEPFADPRRAAAEEFGDMLGEGLMHFLSRGIRAEEITAPEWAMLLSERAALIHGIAASLEARTNADIQVAAAIRSLQAAEDRLSHISAWSLLRYVTAWRQDVQVWRERVAALPLLDTVEAAVAYLGLIEHAHTFGDVQQIAQTRPRGEVAA